MEPTNNNIPQFGTPHSGGVDKFKVFLLLLAIVAIIVFNVFYYFNVFKKASAEAPIVELPPTEEEKAAITEDLSKRKANVTDAEKDAMINNLTVQGETEVGTADREASAKSLYK